MFESSSQKKPIIEIFNSGFYRLVQWYFKIRNIFFWPFIRPCCMVFEYIFNKARYPGKNIEKAFFVSNMDAKTGYGFPSYPTGNWEEFRLIDLEINEGAYLR